jgi:AcrR family transcriptional regulator
VPAPRRSDARRNRAAILRAAGEAFTRGRGAVAVQHIARLAGVSQATVYRHFPDRRALAVAVMEEQLAALGRLVAACAADPTAFRPLLDAVLRTQASMRPLVALVRELPAAEQRRYADQLVAVLDGPWRRSQAVHHLRRDVEPADLLLVLAMLEGAAERAAEGLVPAEGLRRVIDVLLDGLFRPAADGSPVR